MNITKNSYLFLIFQRLNYGKTFKFEKVIEISKCDLCSGTPCILTPSKRKVIISIFHNFEKVLVRRTGAYRHKKSTGRYNKTEPLAKAN